MKKIEMILLGISLMALCCNGKKGETNGTVNQDSAFVFSGNWISKNYLDSLDMYGTPAKVKNIDPMELIINSTEDSICLFNFGSALNIIPIITITDSSFDLNNFCGNDRTEFYLSANKKEISFEDKFKNKKIGSFVKIPLRYAVKNIDSWQSALELYLNERLIAANYFLLDTEKKPGAKVAFTSYGEIVGLPGYTRFKICYGEDCRQRSDDDLIFLSDKGEAENYIWEWKKDTLTFYSVTNVAKPAEPPRYVKGMDIFRFVKK